MHFPTYSADNVATLVLAARSALIQADADLFSIQQSLRAGDGAGGLQPFCLRSLGRDDYQWVVSLQRKIEKLNGALAPFGASLPHPASI